MPDFPPYQIQQVDVLIPSVINARTHSDAQIEQIVGSIKEFGFTNPLIVDDQNNVLAGHGRLLAAQRIGMTHVPTVKMRDLTPEQKRAYMLADNKLALEAGWDEDLLRLEINNLREAGFDIALTGFDEQDIDQLFAAEADPSALWQNMPEFNQPNAWAFRSIMVHFKNQEAVDEFVRILDRKDVTPVTKFIWFPPEPKLSYMHDSYVTEDAAAQSNGEL